MINPICTHSMISHVNIFRYARSSLAFPNNTETVLDIDRIVGNQVISLYRIYVLVIPDFQMRQLYRKSMENDMRGNTSENH